MRHDRSHHRKANYLSGVHILKSRLTCLLKRRDLQRQQITVLSYTKALVIQINCYSQC